MTDVALWGPDVVGITMRDLLDDDELGERVTWEMLMERMAGVYSRQSDREWSMSVLLFGRLVQGGVPLDDPRIVEFQEHAKALDLARAEGSHEKGGA